MNISIRFRKATIKDWKLVEELENAAKNSFYLSRKGEENYKNYIKNCQVFLISIDKKVIGTISYKIEKNNNILINGLTILPEFRGQGIATISMGKLLNTLKNKNLSLVVHPENTPALLVYLKHGFTIKEWRDNHFGNGQPRLYLIKNSK